MGKKVFIKTYGCQMNAYDSDKMGDVLAAAQGYSPTASMDEADLILFNTCSIREKAQEKVFSDLGRARAHKARGARIGVGGCVASQEGAAILQRAPYVDVVFGPQTLHRLPELLQEREQSGQPQVDVSFPEIEKFDHLPLARVEGASAFVSIMEGCSKYCTYCVVPYTRGEEIHRPLADILTEVADLAQRGVKEITLLGQNVNAWHGTLEGVPVHFADLLDYVADMPGVERLRFVTSHPREFTPALIEAFARIPKLAGHLHLPVQHGSDRILAAMKRGYSVLEYKAIVRRLRAARPGLALSTDFIVGFPGETDADFEQLMDLIAACDFDNSFSFVFSPRPGTPAAELPDTTPQAVKLARLQRVQDAIQANMARISAALVGTRQRILVVGASRKDPGELMGRTECNRVVNLPGAPRLIGQMVDVTITHAHPHTLRGVVVTQG